MINVGVIGVGQLGSIHVELLSKLKEFNLVGCYDTNLVKSLAVNTKYNLDQVNNIDDLLYASDALIIATPTTNHFEYAKEAIRLGKHVFIEKPVTHTILQATELIKLASEARIIAQVGHIERFNPAFLALKKYDLNPMFIEVERLSSFPQRGTDVSVVLDLMIHDIDLILKMVKGNVRRIMANGVSVITDSLDIANARIEFDNGCVANLTASRVSAQKERKMRIFQKNAYITVDFLEKKTEIHQLEESELNGFAIPIEKGKGVRIHTPEIIDNNAIEMELKDFAHSISCNVEPSVSVYDGAKALELAYAILRKIQKSIPF